MSRRIVSWKASEPRASVSPAVSSASGGSVVSINSIISDMMPTEATGVQPAEFGAKHTNWPGSANPSTAESFVQHSIYFFKDGNITFLVSDVPCCEEPDLLKKVAGRRHTLLCSSILFLSGLGILLHQIQPA